MLDPNTEAEKYGGAEAQVVMGKIRPVPGQGVVTMDLYIPSYSVFNATASSIAGFLSGDSVGTDYDLGDFRGPTADPGANPLAPVGGAPFHSVKGDVAISLEDDQLRIGGTSVACR